MVDKDISKARVALIGSMLVAMGTCGFYYLPGMLVEDAKGSRIVNSIYCSTITLTTIGYGDICPGTLEPISKLFLVLYAVFGMGFFCGPMLEFASSWRHKELITAATVALGLGVSLFTAFEGSTQSEALYASVITGLTIGYGDITPKTDPGKLAVAAYAVLAINVVGALLQPTREWLENLCRVPDKSVTDEPNSPKRKVSFSDQELRGSPTSPPTTVRKITSGSFREIPSSKKVQ